MRCAHPPRRAAYASRLLLAASARTRRAGSARLCLGIGGGAIAVAGAAACRPQRPQRERTPPSRASSMPPRSLAASQAVPGRCAGSSCAQRAACCGACCGAAQSNVTAEQLAPAACKRPAHCGVRSACWQPHRCAWRLRRQHAGLQGASAPVSQHDRVTARAPTHRSRPSRSTAASELQRSRLRGSEVTVVLGSACSAACACWGGPLCSLPRHAGTAAATHHAV
jgi:hypothetical protein